MKKFLFIILLTTVLIFTSISGTGDGYVTGNTFSHGGNRVVKQYTATEDVLTSFLVYDYQHSEGISRVTYSDDTVVPGQYALIEIGEIITIKNAYFLEFLQKCYIVYNQGSYPDYTMHKRILLLQQFIHDSLNASCTEALTRSYMKFLSGFGLERFLLAVQSRGSLDEREKNFGVLVNYPQEWMTRYLDNHYIEHDPVYRAAIESQKPFTWDEATKRYPGKDAAHVMNEAGDFGLAKGAGVSMILPGGRIAGFGFSTSHEDLDVSPEALRLLKTASFHFLDTYMDLSGMDLTVRTNHGITAREKEILQWIACGYTKQQISDRLNISLSCVKRHCENVSRKFETRSLAHSVARAIQCSLINPY